MRLYLQSCQPQTDGFHGGLAQLARALAWHARGRRFDPDTLHHFKSCFLQDFLFKFPTLGHSVPNDIGKAVGLTTILSINLLLQNAGFFY